MNIDERLEALTQSLEILTHDMHSAQEQAKRLEERTRRLDNRDRRLREALMAGVAAYLQVLAEGDDDAEAEA